MRLYFFLFSLFFITSILSCRSINQTNKKDVDVMQRINLLEQKNDSLKNLVHQALSSNDSIRVQNSILKEGLKDQGIKELYFSELLSINTSWFGLIVAIVGGTIGAISWGKYRTMDEKMKCLLEVATTKIDIEFLRIKKENISQRIKGQEETVCKTSSDPRFAGELKNFLLNTLEMIECDLRLYTKGKSVDQNEVTVIDLERSFREANTMFEKYTSYINFCTCEYLNKLGDCIKQDIDSINNKSLTAQYDKLYTVIKDIVFRDR